MKKSKILVINEPFIRNFCRPQRWAAKTRGRAMRAPDWLAYATAVLEKNNFDVELYDFAARNWDKRYLFQLISIKKPAVVVLDSSTPSIYSDIECAKICKKASKDTFVIMVGPHATSNYEEVLKLAEGNIDAIARGEYDYTVLEIVQRILSGDQGDILSDCLGVSYIYQGTIKNNPDRPLIENLDELPFPAYHFLNIMDYFDGGKLYPYLTIIGGRGCPFRCTFCLWPQVMHGRRYRLRSAENIIEEIEYSLKKWPLLKYGEFFFEDDTFTASLKRAHRFCDLLLEKNIKITWSLNARADIIDEELFRKMKLSGARTFWLGIESMDQNILNNVKKGITVEQIENFIRTVHKYKLQVHGCFILGLPGETKETMEYTLKKSLEIGVDTLQFSAVVPFPGTEYFEYCEKNNLLLTKEWDKWLTAGEQGTVVTYPGLTKEEIEKNVNRGLAQFYFRPSFLIKFLLKSKNLSDIYRKFRGGWNFVNYLIENLFERM